MKKFCILSLIFVLGLTFASTLSPTASGQKGKFQRSENGVPNRYIVMLNDKFVDSMAVAPAIESEAAFLTSQYGGSVKGVYANAFKGFVVEMPEESAIALSSDERVSLVEQDAEISASATQVGATWGIDRIDQRSLPLNSQYTYGPDASNVHAYIIDSGIRPTHVEFGGRATADFDALTDGQNGIDCSGHGTHVAGTVGGATYGVAKNVRLHGVRVLPCAGSGLVSNLIMGVDWVTANHVKPAVANISITASGGSSVIDAAIQSAVNAGVTFVVAAGNNNLNACNYSPARIPAAITVGATYTADEKAGYSNWGACVDVWAPGSIITSASHTTDTGTRVMSGTSMASPHVTGVAALYLANNPLASPTTVSAKLIATATQGVVTGLDTDSPNRLAHSWLGAGKVIIKKIANARGPESGEPAEFPYNATNFEASSFTLQPQNQIVDPDVTAFGSANTITVTEGQIFGWALTSISCVETSGSSLPNAVNTTIDLQSRRANIVVEEGEQIECTFTSEELAPSAAPASVSGRVVTSDGMGIRSIRLALLDANTGQTRYATTNTFGFYSFSDVTVSHFYVLTAESTKRYRLQNNVRSFTLTDDLADVDFVSRVR